MNGHFRADADQLGGRPKARMGNAYVVKPEGKVLWIILPAGIRRGLTVKLIDLARQIDRGDQRAADGVVHFQA